MERSNRKLCKITKKYNGNRTLTKRILKNAKELSEQCNNIENNFLTEYTEWQKRGKEGEQK